VEGRILPEEPWEQWFDRFPVAARRTVTPAVWNLSRDSAGMVVRFMTNATAIHIHYSLQQRIHRQPSGFVISWHGVPVAVVRSLTFICFAEEH
jgi:hypothetical protein